MWNLNEIRNRKKYIKKELKDYKGILEREKALLTLDGYSLMMRDIKINDLNFLEKQIYNFLIDFKCNNKYNVKQTFNEDYYQFLLKLCLSIMSREDIIEDKIKYSKLNLSSNDMAKISSDFYKKLDIDIYNIVAELYNKKDHILYKKRSKYNDHLYGAITYNDHIFNDSYILVYRKNNITDLLSINHEIMHAVDFKIKPKIHTNNYFGFCEVPTNTIDCLFINYLVEEGFNKNELYNIYNRSIFRTKTFSIFVIKKIMDSLNVDYKNGFIDIFNYEKVSKILNLEIKSKLLEIESMILGNCICDKITDDLSNISILKDFMNNRIDPNSIPDFSKYGIDNESMINYCLNRKKLVKK